MKRRNRALAALLWVAATTLGQGSLVPPGVPAPTMKSLDEIDANIAVVSNAVKHVDKRIDLATVEGNGSCHHVISQPGSYYLSGNLEVTKSDGIKIETSDVTLDLNGFTISRVSGSGGDGILVGNGNDRITVRNGSISGFDYGILCYWGSSPYSKDCLFERVAVSSCGTYGIEADGEANRLVDCRVCNNTGSGLFVGDDSILSGCSATTNQDFGFRVGNASSLSGCSAIGNGQMGIEVGEGSTLVGCSAHGNGWVGIYVGAGSTLECCCARNNGNAGISTGEGSSLLNCDANHNKGTSSFESCGIEVSANSSVIGCSVCDNYNTNSPGTYQQGVGIRLNQGGTIRNCTVSGNQGDGILIQENGLVEGNCCRGNGGGGGDGAGIHAMGEGCRIAGNEIVGNDRGIQVDISGNFVVRNTAHGNGTNWVVAANNACLVVQRTGCPAISGDAGGSAPGSGDPSANFTY